MMNSVSSDELDDEEVGPLIDQYDGGLNGRYTALFNSNLFERIRREYKKADVIFCILTILGLVLAIVGILFIAKVFPWDLKGYESLTGFLLFIVGMGGIVVCLSVLGERWLPSRSNSCWVERCRRL
jgi:protein-S-isoprenylcysteine O-methyltransferase Ste14